MERKDIRLIKDFSPEEKPREKLKNLGLHAVENVELMAILLGSGTKGENVLQLADKVLDMIKHELFFQEISLEDLMEIKGIGLSKASTILAGIELGRRLQLEDNRRSIQINNPQSIADYYYTKLRHEMKEHFCVLLLDTKNRIIAEEKISEGSLNASIVHPREVFKPAIRKSANSVILIHNHPSGDTEPSREDIEVTKRLVEAGEIIGISVLDHIIIGDHQYLSMKKESYF